MQTKSPNTAPMALSGVHSVLPTPFATGESLDEAGLRDEIDFYITRGVDGIVLLGVLGEADKLADDERERVVAVALEQAAGRVQVTIGVTHNSTVVAARRAQSAEQAGASAVMVAPPQGMPASAAHFRRIMDAISIPVVVQDYPPASGVHMSVDFLARLQDVVVKLEDAPTAAKIGALHAAAPHQSILGGLGGVSLLEELDAGASGTMTGFAFPEALVEVLAAHRAGDRTRARRTFERALPLLRFEAQPGGGAAVRKEILRRRGAIASATVRQPARPLDPSVLATLDRLLDTVSLGSTS